MIAAVSGSVAIDRDDHDPLEMVDPMVLAGAHRDIFRSAARGVSSLTGHWGDSKVRTGAESVWRAIVGQR